MSSRNFDSALFKRLRTEAHVWYCKSDEIHDSDTLTAFKSILSVQETERYERFQYEKDRHSYLLSHALLRHVLSKYADVKASQWQFSCNEHGKPELEQGAIAADDNLTADVTLRFNLTHTDGLCACVITLDNACGIDTENIHRQNNLTAVAQRMFAQEELTVLRAGADDNRLFYNFWTLREAYVKALGVGLAGASKNYYFSLSGERRTASLNFKSQRQGENNQWQFYLFEPTGEHCLAVAIESVEPVSVHISKFVF